MKSIWFYSLVLLGFSVFAQAAPGLNLVFTSKKIFLEFPDKTRFPIVIDKDGKVFYKKGNEFLEATTAVGKTLARVYKKWKDSTPQGIPPLALAVIHKYMPDQPPEVTAPPSERPRLHATPGQPSARQTAPPSRLECTDPYKAICDVAKNLPTHQGKQIAKRRADFERFKREFRLPDHGDKLEQDHAESWITYIRGLQIRTEENVVFIHQQFQRHKQMMLDQINIDPALDWNQKAAVKGSIRNVKIASLANTVIQNGASPYWLAQFQSSCGSDGLSYGAFFLRDQNTIYYCPSYGLLRNYNYLTYMFLHELGHSVDIQHPQSGPMYHQLLACYQDSRFNRFVKGSKMGELTADYRAISAFMNALPPIGTTTSQETLQMAAEFLGEYCIDQGVPQPSAGPKRPSLERALAQVNTLHQQGQGTPEAPTHPNEDFKIGVMLGRQPEFRARLGCPAVSQNMPACNSTGLVRAEPYRGPALTAKK